jgi:hypothetical protein
MRLRQHFDPDPDPDFDFDFDPADGPAVKAPQRSFS